MNHKIPLSPAAVRRGKIIAKLSTEALARYLDVRFVDTDLMFKVTHHIMSADPDCAEAVRLRELSGRKAIAAKAGA